MRAFASPELRIDDPAPTTCDLLFNDFVSESLKIRSCISDTDCGQSLAGTSCGCTRDHIARKDADTSAFYQLLAQAKENGCSDSLPITSACDCPQVSGTTCIAGMCDWKS